MDGECSTNDCVIAAGQRRERRDHRRAQLSGVSQRPARGVCRELALGIVRGGEGATKLVTVVVTGAASSAEARQAAKAIANSPLVKTAIHGGDPNWGRLIAVAGRAGVAFELDRAAVSIGSTVLFKDGHPHDEAAPLAADTSRNGFDGVGGPRRRARFVHGVDLRPERGVRPYQRGLPNMTKPPRKLARIFCRSSISIRRISIAACSSRRT